ncbi:MAG: hypothetical protein ACJAU0_002220 [Flavobacteriales bacterium]|jgi:hypothetical protein
MKTLKTLFLLLSVMTSTSVLSQLSLSSTPIAENGLILASPCESSVTLIAQNTLYVDFQNPSTYSYSYTFFKNGVSQGSYSSSLPTFTNLNANLFIDEGDWYISCIVYAGTNSPITLNTPSVEVGFTATIGEYDSDKIKYRTVSGDFDNDGYQDDLAAFYDYGSTTTTIHVWKKGSGNSLSYQGDNGWYTSTTFDAVKASGSVVSGDFDHDGYIDDIAVMYNYDGNSMKIMTWYGDASSQTFVFQGYWYSSSQWNATQSRYRVVSGDFDNDGYLDDICAFYEYPSFLTKGHVWYNDITTSSFDYEGVWYDSGSGNFDGAKIKGRVVCGDFDNDGYHDDVAAMYEYQGYLSKIFVWKSTGSTFSSISTYFNSGSGNYDASKVTHRMSTIDCDNDGYIDDIVALYNQGNGVTSGHVFKSNSSSFTNSTIYTGSSNSFEADYATGKMTSGDFDHDGYHDDISTFYWVDQFSTKNFTFLNNNCIIKPAQWWVVCRAHRTQGFLNEFIETNEIFEVFPNPTDGIITMKFNSEFHSNSISIYSGEGKLIKTINNLEESAVLDFQFLQMGVYLIRHNESNHTQTIVRY